MPLIAYTPGWVEALRVPTPEAPWRVLLSGCMAGWPCGVDASSYGMEGKVPWVAALPTVRLHPFCPEDVGLGTPRTMPDLHGGDGRDVLAGRARVLDEHGRDLTEGMVRGAEAMVRFAAEVGAEWALLTDMSAACGSQVVAAGCRFDRPRRYQKGVGVATAHLLQAGLGVVSWRDFATLAGLRAKAEPGWAPPAGLRDHQDHPWVRGYFG